MVGCRCSRSAGELAGLTSMAGHRTGLGAAAARCTGRGRHCAASVRRVAAAPHRRRRSSLLLPCPLRLLFAVAVRCCSSLPPVLVLARTVCVSHACVLVHHLCANVPPVR